MSVTNQIKSPNYYLQFYKKLINDYNTNSYSENLTNHKKFKEQTLNTYISDCNNLIQNNLFLQIKNMIKEEHSNYKKKHLNELELEYEKMINEIYRINIGLKSYDDVDILLSDWQKIEEEFLNKTDTQFGKRYEILHKTKSIRLKENLKKLIKNMKVNDEEKIKRMNEEFEKISNQKEVIIKDLQSELKINKKEKENFENNIKFFQDELKEKNVEIEIYKEIINKKQEEMEIQNYKKDNMRVSHSALFKINTANENVPKCEYCLIC